MSEQFSLCWDNFHKNMSAGMQSLLESEDLVDVTLAVEGRILKAHKMVLSVCSPYFRDLFQSNPCQHPIVFMKDVSYIALSDLVQFMYQGEVQVAQEHLSNFIKTAEALQIKGLTADGPQDSEETQTTEEEKTVVESSIKHSTELKPTPPSKVRRLAGPACKRPKYTSPSVDETSGPVQATSNAISSNPDEPANSISDVIQFKMEPDNTHQNNSATVDDSHGEGTYGDYETLDDTQDDTDDYGLMETTEEEPKAGTSADGASDGQDIKYEIEVSDHYERKAKKPRATTRTRYVLGGFVYHNKLVAGRNPVRYLVCAEMKRTGCHARATLPVYGTIDQLRVTKPHNHPPDENASEREEFMKCLREAAQSMSGSLKKIYDNIALLYPRTACDITFKNVRSSLHRWRHNTFQNI